MSKAIFHSMVFQQSTRSVGATVMSTSLVDFLRPTLSSMANSRPAQFSAFHLKLVLVLAMVMSLLLPASTEGIAAANCCGVDLKPGERRPGIITHHPTAKYGKQTFEGWPNSNFVTEMAMPGFVVIVPDYPTIGEASDVDLATDRYDSGPIRGILAHLANIEKSTLTEEGMDPVGVLKTMAATEADGDEFFVYLDQVHKIIRDRTQMIAIFAVAKESKYQTELVVPWGPTVAEVHWIVASRDKDRPYEYKLKHRA